MHPWNKSSTMYIFQKPTWWMGSMTLDWFGSLPPLNSRPVTGRYLDFDIDKEHSKGVGEKNFQFKDVMSCHPWSTHCPSLVWVACHCSKEKESCLWRCTGIPSMATPTTSWESRRKDRSRPSNLLEVIDSDMITVLLIRLPQLSKCWLSLSLSSAAPSSSRARKRMVIRWWCACVNKSRIDACDSHIIVLM